MKTINITDKTGMLIAIKTVKEKDDLMIINKSGIIIRMQVEELRVMGRATQGVRLIRLEEGDSIASVAKVEVDDEQEVITEPVNPTSTNSLSEYKHHSISLRTVAGVTTSSVSQSGQKTLLQQ